MTKNGQEDFFPDIDIKNELPRLLSAAELLRNPFKEGERFSDNVVMTGKVSQVGDVIFIDVDDETPVAVSDRVKRSVELQFPKEALSILDTEKSLSGNNSLIVGGSLVGVQKTGKDNPEMLRYAMLKRGLYLRDNPDEGFLVSPEAINHPGGGCAEKLSTTMLKEAQEEVQIFLMGRNRKSLQVSDGLSDLFGGLSNTKISPVVMSLKGLVGLSDDEHKELLNEFRYHVLQKSMEGEVFEFPLDHLDEVDARLIMSILDDPVVMDVRLDDSKKSLCEKVITRINGEVFDEAEGVPYMDTRYNTFELTQPLVLDIPRDRKIIHLLGCEPDFDRQALFFNEDELKGVGLTAKHPHDEGLEPGGLSRSTYALFHNHLSDLSFGDVVSSNSPLYDLAVERQYAREVMEIEAEMERPVESKNYDA